MDAPGGAHVAMQRRTRQRRAFHLQLSGELTQQVLGPMHRRQDFADLALVETAREVTADDLQRLTGAPPDLGVRGYELAFDHYQSIPRALEGGRKLQAA